MIPSGAILNPAADHACKGSKPRIIKQVSQCPIMPLVLVERERDFGVYHGLGQAPEQQMNMHPSAVLLPSLHCDL